MMWQEHVRFGDYVAENINKGVGRTCPPLYPPNGSEFFHGSVTECTSGLPLDLLMGRYRMLRFDPGPGADPYVLYDPNGKIVGVWEDRPSFWELMEVAHG
jgi:hypothetical protein